MTDGEPNPGEGASEAPGTPIQLGERTGGRPETPPLLSPATYDRRALTKIRPKHVGPTETKRAARTAAPGRPWGVAGPARGSLAVNAGQLAPGASFWWCLPFFGHILYFLWGISGGAYGVYSPVISMSPSQIQ